jgi:SAM-dependent methyltransferase
VTSHDHLFRKIGSYYDGLVQRHGYSPYACDYGRIETQALKFEVLSQVADLRGKRILDVGCGFADFADFLDSKFEDITYTGVDISEAMVTTAKMRNPALDIRRLNILEEYPGSFDFVTANGIFYLLGSDAWPLMQQLVARMFECATEAICFNSLSRWETRIEEGEFHADPAQTIAFCRTLTPWVSLRHDYHPRDFTVYMYRSARR